MLEFEPPEALKNPPQVLVHICNTDPFVPEPILNVSLGLVVPIPTLPFNSVMFEFVSPEGGVPASKGTVPVCAAALIANAAMQIAAAILLCIVFLILS
jgi:hypothetical protein